MKKANKSFTFVEVMLALSMFAIIALSLYSTFSVASLAWRKSQDSNRIYREAKWALDEIAKQLRDASFFDFSRHYPDLKLFDGQEDKITFLIADDSGLKRISFFLEKPDFGTIHKVVIGKRGKMPDKIVYNYEQVSQRLLTLQEKTHNFLDSLSNKTGTEESFNLTSLVKEGGLKFSYAYKTAETEALENLVWKDRFESQGQIPRLVKITLTLVNPKNLKQERSFEKIVFIPTGEFLTSE